MKYADTYLKLSDFGKKLLYTTSLLDGLPLISKYTKDVIGADRCSIFINDSKSNELWTTLADGVDKIIVPKDEGIVGQTIAEKKTIFSNDVYLDKNFMSDIDKDTGYITENIIATPIFNSEREIVGVLELLNKEDGFKEEDVKFMKFFAHYISGFLELVLLIEKR